MFHFFLDQFLVNFDKTTKIISAYEITFNFKYYSNSVAI